MRTSRIIIIVVVVAILVVAAIAVVSILTAAAPKCTPTWSCAARYPVEVGGTFAIAGQQCVSTDSAIYCIGGLDANMGPRSEIYYSVPAPSGNITGWNLSSTSYPQFINGQSCVLYSGTIYCVGGSYNDAGDDVASSYYTSVPSAGPLGNWTSSTAYPVPVDTESCVASSAYIYCVGGVNETDGSNADATQTNSVWYAHLSASGIGEWTKTLAYPANVFYPTCYADGSDVYCIGGADSNGNSVGTVYYAALSSSGVGSWTPTTAYPVAGSGQACVIYSGNILCVGGETSGGSSPTYTSAVYYAPISSGGIGAWKQATSYPFSVGTTCAAISGEVYCVGGFDQSSVNEDSNVEYASMASLTG